jgi:hypothetical protein
MPRSGSTLIEQILAAHSQCVGGGEMLEMYTLPRSLPDAVGSGASWPECVLDMTQSDVDNVSREYLECMRRHANRIAGNEKAVRIVDKNLLNHLCLGLIALLVPRATVIHTTREPLDTCLSCYAEMLSPIDHPYATRLDTIAIAYREYERIMEHWRASLNLHWLDVPYESLISDQETWTRAILDHCGLAWEERCLRPQQVKRTIRTLSHYQVRQSVYTSSIGRAARFGSHLDPLRQVLGSIPSRNRPAHRGRNI